MKTAISIPDVLFAAVERLARQLGISRSELFARAMKAFLAKNSEVGVTEKLNAVYGNEESELDPTLQTMQFQSIGEDSW
jgi:metal-responsive CopG/Arc/MetJ family transcriptional regulator